ncbi:shikimate kinase [Planctomicrobium sp. SH664]|uniref:shikimate kinase n=1 Tax=Planctomicrobium sp. SH664 TaxID=3448125 RepID=UPI003F5C2346
MVISLIGYRGTGKTTVAASLANRLRWDFVDLDPEIERHAGKSIAAIFAEHGEPHFRHLEQMELFKHLGRQQLVLSAGGGAVVNEDNQRAMQAAGPVVWLQATVSTIVERLSQDPHSALRRPALAGEDPISEISLMVARREPIYSRAATIAVATDHRTIDGIVDEIVARLPPLTGGVR